MIGQILNGAYQLTELVGSGGYADVYRARDLRSGGIVAVKLLHSHVARVPGVIARFEREIALARRLQAPAVARILDAGRDPATPPYMVMELILGQTVAQIVEQRGPLPAPLVVEIVDGLLGALKQAHALGIVHRDLKPHNLMLDEAGRVRVLDFGVARAIGVGTITADGQLLGTPEYMAPEQLDGRPIDGRADLYAVGAVLYHLLAGRPPYIRTSDSDLWEIVRRVRREPPPPLQQLRPQLAPALVEIVDRAMARELAQRYQSAYEMQQALALAAGADPPTPPPFQAPLGAVSPAGATLLGAPPPASGRDIDDERPTVILPALPHTGAPATPGRYADAPGAPLQPAPNAFGDQPTRIVRRPADQTQVLGAGQPPPTAPQPPGRSQAGPVYTPPHQPPPHQPPPLPGPVAAATVAYTPPAATTAAGRRGGLSGRVLALIVATAGLLLIGAVSAFGWLATAPLRRAVATPTAVTPAAVVLAPTQTPVAGPTSGAAATPRPADTPASPAVAPAPPRAFAPPTAPPSSPPAVVASPPAAVVAPSARPSTPAPTAPPPMQPQPQQKPQQRPQPPAAATASPQPPTAAPPGSEIILEDRFDRSEGGLLTRISPRPDDYTFSYERGEYAIKKLNPTLPAAPIVFVRGEYADTVVAVDVRLVGEAGARYAFLVCRDRSSSSQTRQYRASIVPEGRRVILSHWQEGTQRVLAETRDNPAVQFGNATNRLELRCVGPKIEVIVNGKSVVSAEEGTLASGEHGLGAGTFSGVEGTLEARFDNLEIRAP